MLCCHGNARDEFALPVPHITSDTNFWRDYATKVKERLGFHLLATSVPALQVKSMTIMTTCIVCHIENYYYVIGFYVMTVALFYMVVSFFHFLSPVSDVFPISGFPERR
ncbi:hypothetical protein CEXT_60791 [Caerostris extrusa]|uniref:Uncharacterized protein n=1 Tax=Caerostris extrusa TaxID=172846 RepID=A0AAV4UIG9_CAEEX|nr:hypothetical protein CEXT_60791 [Caerostris extrusa]